MKRIQHSDIYRARFQKNVKLLRYNATSTTYVKQLSSSNHRFDSHSLPFSRGVVFWLALVRTAQQMQDERKGKEEGHDARRFLTLVTEEFAISFAMLADAGAET